MISYRTENTPSVFSPSRGSQGTETVGLSRMVQMVPVWVSCDWRSRCVCVCVCVFVCVCGRSHKRIEHLAVSRITRTVTSLCALFTGLCYRLSVEASWNVMAHAQKPDFVFRRNVRVHLNRRGRQFSRLLAAELCASAVVMLDTPCSEVVWRVLATHSIRQFPLHFPTRASPCAITF